MLFSSGLYISGSCNEYRITTAAFRLLSVSYLVDFVSAFPVVTVLKIRLLISYFFQGSIYVASQSVKVKTMSFLG